MYMVPRDAFGNELHEGDYVVCIFPGYRYLVRGKIVKLNKHRHKVQIREKFIAEIENQQMAILYSKYSKETNDN